MVCLQKAVSHVYEEVTDLDQSLVFSLLAFKVSLLAACDLEVGMTDVEVALFRIWNFLCLVSFV